MPKKDIDIEIEEAYESDNLWIDDNHIVIHDTRKLNKPDISYWKSISPYFTVKEIESDNHDIIAYLPALKAINAVRVDWATWAKRNGYPRYLIMNCWYRNHHHNARVYRETGRKINVKSDHTTLLGRRINSSAGDIHIVDRRMGMKLEELAIKHGFNAIGRYNTFIHVSIRKPRWKGRIAYWGRRWF